MAVTANSVVASQGLNGGTTVKFLPADTTALKTIFTAGGNGSFVFGIAATSDDTSDVNVRLLVTRSAVDYLIATVRVATLAGTDGAVNAVNLLNATACPWTRVDADGNRYLPLVSGDVLKAAMLATVTAAKTVTLVTNGEDL